MNTVTISDAFWNHMPTWLWPVIAIGIVGFVVYQLIKASESVSRLFGSAGRHIRDRATVPKRTLKLVERLEDSLECAMTYLVDDAEWHDDADIIITESCPKVRNLLPARISFTEYRKRWREGWRPPAYQED